jgi:hypothetical protein
MEKVLATIFSFIVFFVGLAFLITGRPAIGLLLIAVSLFLKEMGSGLAIFQCLKLNFCTNIN